jgi:hypothetical protein
MFSLAKSDQQQTPIAITDPIIEHSAVLNCLFEIVYDHVVGYFARDSIIQYVIDLSDKWDIPVIRTIINQELRGRLFQKKAHEHALDLFLTAVKLGDNILAQGIAKTFDVDWKSYSTGSKTNQAPAFDVPSPPVLGDRFYDEPSGNRPATKGISSTGSIFDLNGIEYRDFLRIPPSTVWCLIQATSYTRDSGSPFNKDEACKELLTIMEELSESFTWAVV